MKLVEKLRRCAEVLDQADDVEVTVYDGPFAVTLDGEKAREAVRMLKKGWGAAEALRASGAKVRRLSA